MDATIKNAPERIYLCLGGDLPGEEIEFHELHDVTWCADKQDANDIEYVLAALPSDAAQAPQGWKLMPDAPTHTMVGAGARAILEASERTPSLNSLDMERVAYPAMLATAPVASAEAARPDTADAVFRRRLDLEIQNLTVNGNNEITWMAISCRGVVSSLSTDKGAARASAAAVRTLEAKGYTYLEGAEMWKPPIGQPPAWVAHDTQAARDVLTERVRQVRVEGWTPMHDDQHADGDLALAASVYAASAGGVSWPDSDPYLWPWDREWWKPTTPRRDLVKAAALILAEIERIDRAESGNESAAAQDDAQ